MTAGPLDAVTRLPGVFEAAEAARSSVDALLRDLRSPELRGLVPQVVSLALVRSAEASAALEPDPGQTAQEAAARVTAELPGLVAVWHRAPWQALARLHGLAAAGQVPADELGRPRADADLASRLSGLADLVLGADAPAVVVAGIAHGELLATAPFTTRNGLVARAASRLVLLDRGLDPHGVLVPEEGHLTLGRTVYAEALEAYRTGTPDGVAQWLVHCATALALGARVARTLV